MYKNIKYTVKEVLEGKNNGKKQFELFNDMTFEYDLCNIILSFEIDDHKHAYLIYQKEGSYKYYCDAYDPNDKSFILYETRFKETYGEVKQAMNKVLKEKDNKMLNELSTNEELNLFSDYFKNNEYIEEDGLPCLNIDNRYLLVENPYSNNIEIYEIKNIFYSPVTERSYCYTNIQSYRPKKFGKKFLFKFSVDDNNFIKRLYTVNNKERRIVLDYLYKKFEA